MVIAYTDGSAIVKGEKLGGFGIYIIDEEGEEYFFSEGYRNTKTGRMELRAIITTLKKVAKDKRLTIYSDSMYCVNCVNERWLWKWERNLWMNIKNVDLVKQYLEEYRKFQFPPKLVHIKGHTKKDDKHSLGNAIVDLLADYKNHKIYKNDIYEEIVL